MMDTELIGGDMLQHNLTFKQARVPDDGIDIAKEFELSAKTAIHRSGITLPLRFLLERGVFDGAKTALNFGKGKANFDAPAIAKITGHCDEFDLTLLPKWDVFSSTYDVLVSCYCANVLVPRCRSIFWRQLALLTDEYGTAYVAVRSCKDTSIKGEPLFDGVRVKRTGTFQIGYEPTYLLNEARRYFGHCELIQPNASKSYLIVACKHQLHAVGH